MYFTLKRLKPAIRNSYHRGISKSKIPKGRANNQYPITNDQCPSADSKPDHWKLDIDYWIFKKNGLPTLLVALPRSMFNRAYHESTEI
jgi:hypothetical protein